MKILIFTAGYGNGHIQVSKKLNKLMTQEGTTRTYEAIKLWARPLDMLIKACYNKLLLPNSNKFIVRQLYDLSCTLFGNKANILVTNLVITPFISIINFIHKPDIVIQTFPIHGHKKMKFHNIVFVTDYGAHNFWIDKTADQYFVATEYTKKQLISKGVNENIITVSGIPINDDFYYDRHFDNTSLTNSKVLFSFGAKGIKYNHVYKEHFFKLINNGFSFTIICGKNKKLFKILKKEFKNYPQANILGYTTNMAEIMKEHDVLVTKPGGITLTEAIYSEIPVIINTELSILGQEKFNINFVNDMEIGIVSNNKNIVDDIFTLINDPKKYSNAIQTMKKLKVPNQNEIILDTLHNITKR